MLSRAGRLHERGLGGKRNLALREFARGDEAQTKGHLRKIASGAEPTDSEARNRT